MKTLFTLSLFAASITCANNTIPDSVVKIENDQSSPKTKTIATLEHRPAKPFYFVSGLLRQCDVEGAAMLEMWNIMPDGTRYFSRQPFANLGKANQEGWQKFTLPFNLMDIKPEIVKLEINVVLPGKGTVEVSNLQVGETKAFISPLEGGFIGAILGSFWGLYGGLLGLIGGYFVPRGKCRKLLAILLIFGFVMGIVQLAGGLAAWCFGQPYHIWYPFALVGGLLVVMFPCFMWQFKKSPNFQIPKSQNP